MGLGGNWFVGIGLLMRFVCFLSFSFSHLFLAPSPVFFPLPLPLSSTPTQTAYIQFLRLLKSYNFPTPPGYTYPTNLGSSLDDDDDEDDDMKDDEDRGDMDGGSTFQSHSRSRGNGRSGGQAQGSGLGSGPSDPGQRRELKIKQYRMEKEWREKVEVSRGLMGVDEVDGVWSSSD